MARLRRKNRNLLLVSTIVIITAVFIIAVYFFQTRDNNQDVGYGKINDVDIEQEQLLAGESDEEEERIPLTCTVIDCDDALSVFIDIGQTEILYDAGYEKNGKDIVNKISSKVDSNLDYMIVSHSHADHAGGVPAVMNAFDVGTVITSGEKKGSSEQFEKAMKAIKKENCEVLDDEDMGFDLGNGARLSIYEVYDPDEEDNPNNLSVVATITYGQDTILITGDSEKEVEKRLKGKFDEVSLYVAGHHMSNTSNTLALLQEWSPDYIVGSCMGEGSEYGFPHKEVVVRCISVTTSTYATYNNGDITYTTNGASDSIDAKEALSIEDAA